MSDPAPLDDAPKDALFALFQEDRPFSETAEQALELARQYLNVQNAHLTRIDSETDFWHAAVSTDEVDGQFPPGLELDLETTYCRRVIEQRDAIELHEASEQGWENDPAYLEHGVECYFGSPLLPADEVYGTVCFVSEDPRPAFTAAESLFAELTVELLERELEQMQHESQLVRQANLANVLNRVLRHNLRNNLTVIKGHTEMMSMDGTSPDNIEVVLEEIDGLMELTNKARELDKIIAEEFEREEVDLVALLEDVVTEIQDEAPEATVTMAVPEDSVVVSALPSLRRAFVELVENAAKHTGADPAITVSVTLVPNGVEITIEDDGPGLPAHEQQVIESGVETPLTHGSGLGLWLVYWIITSHDGTVDIAVDETGTAVTLELPRGAEPQLEGQLAEFQRVRDQYQALFENAQDGMIILDEEERILDANQTAAELYGLDRDAFIGRSIREFIPASIDFDQAWQEFKGAGAETARIPIVTADGTRREVMYSATANVIPGQHFIIVHQTDPDGFLARGNIGPSNRV